MKKEEIVKYFNRTVRLEGSDRFYVLRKYMAYRDERTGKLEHCVQLVDKSNMFSAIQVGIEEVHAL